jgi:hypothetical protein
MSLKNLVGVSLDTIAPSREIAQRLIAAVERLIADAKIEAGHHYTAIQTLPLTLGVDARTVARLDYLRKQRNVTEYSGDLVSDADLVECIKQAQALNAIALAWLKRNRTDLL